MEEKVIINEFLTFVQNKIDVIDELSIVQICATNFTAEEIECGKTELFNALVSEGVKHIQRKGEDKSKKNIKDVIKAFKETEPSRQPTFVAKNLNRLPPVSFDHVDVTRLLKDIVILKNELQSLRNDSVSKSEMHEWQTRITSEISSLKSSSSVNERQYEPKRLGNKAESSVKKRRKQQQQSSNDEHCNDRSVTDRASSVETIVGAVPSYRDIALCPTITNDAQLRLNRKPKPECNTIVRREDTEFTLVENKRRKHRNNNLRGTAQCVSSIKVAEMHTSIYVSRLLKSTSCEDMTSYIREMGQECVDVQLLKQKYETSFNSFKIVVSRGKLENFLKNDFWPEGVKFRIFRERAAVLKDASQHE